MHNDSLKNVRSTKDKLIIMPREMNLPDMELYIHLYA